MNVFKKILLIPMLALPITLSAQAMFTADFRDGTKWGEPLVGDTGAQLDTSQTNSVDYPVTITVSSVGGGGSPGVLFRANDDGFGIIGQENDEIDNRKDSPEEKLRVHFSHMVWIKEILITDIFEDEGSGEEMEYSIDNASYTNVKPLVNTGPNGEFLITGLSLHTIDIWFRAPSPKNRLHDFSVGSIKACIPEPSTYLLLGSTLMIAAVMRRKKVTA